MNKRKNNLNYYKKLNTNNISQREINQNKKRRKYPYGFILFFLISIIKDLFYLSAIIILKIYCRLKIDEITHKGYLLLFALESLSNGGSIYYIIISLIKFYDLYSPFNQEWTYIYIWIICCFQLLFLFTSIILFLMKYIYIKLFFISKFKIIFTILCIILILFNFSSLNDLNHDKYSFQIQSFEMNKLSIYKEYFKRHYINLYLNKETDVNEYELCFEMGYPNNFTEVLKKEPRYSLWKFDKKKDYFIGCRNISFKDNKSINKDNPYSFFKCDTNNKINILPNYCVTAKIRNQKYNFIYKFNIFQILLLISFFIYAKICHYILYKYNLYNNISKETYENLQEKNEDDNDDGEEGEEDMDEEGGDYEGEEEEDEEEQEEEEEVEEKINYRRNKYRKIRKKKKKYYKKKYRFRKYNFSNNDNQNNQNNNNINDEEEDKDEKNDEENNEYEEEEKEKENEEKKEKLIKNEDENNIKDNNDEKSNNDNIKANIEDNIEENNKDIQKDNNNNNEDDKKVQNLLSNNNSHKRNGFIYHFFLGGIVDKIKNKFYNILKEIDKDIREDEEN